MNSGYLEAINEIVATLHQQGANVNSLPTAIYARKSTPDESQVSLKTQINSCKKYIEGQKQLKLVSVYSEDNISGFHVENRKEFNKLLEEVRKGTIKAVVYYSVDRETRNVQDGILLDLEFEKLNCLQIYATQYFERNANGRFLKAILRADAQRTVEEVSEKTTNGMRTVTDENRATGARRPYGYTVVDKYYVINPDEAPAVQMMFEKAEQGMSLPDISTALFKKGYLTRDGKKFPVTTIWNMLKNEKYKGTYLYARADRKSSDYRVSRKDFGEVRKPHGMPHIISDELFDKVQVALSKIGKKKTNKEYQTYLLTGVLKCGTCGHLMHGEASIGGHSHKRYCHYKCPRSSNCSTSIRKEYIERATAEVVANAFNSVYLQHVSTLTMARKVNSSKRNESATITKKISNLKAEQLTLAKSLGRLTSPELFSAINDDINDKQAEIKQLEANQLALKNSNCSVNSVGGFQGITADELLANEELFAKLIKLFILEITIEKDKVVFSLNDLRQ